MKLEGFPGHLESKQTGVANRSKYVPTDEQTQWILDQYNNPTIKLPDIAETIGASTVWINLFCYKNGHRRIPTPRQKHIKATQKIKEQNADKTRKLVQSSHDTIIPDQQLIAIVNKDYTPHPIGSCIGNTCYCYSQCAGLKGAKHIPPTTCHAMF